MHAHYMLKILLYDGGESFQLTEGYKYDRRKWVFWTSKTDENEFLLPPKLTTLTLLVTKNTTRLFWPLKADNFGVFGLCDRGFGLVCAG